MSVHHTFYIQLEYSFVQLSPSELKVKETETGYSTYLNISLVHCIQIMMLIRYIIMYMNSTQLLCAWMENFYRN